MSRPTGKRDSARAARAQPEETAGALSGDLTIYHVAEQREALSELLARGVRRFDLSGVAEIDSSGLQLLAALRHSVSLAGRQPEFVKAPQSVQAACALCGLDAWLAPAASAQEAQ